MRIPREKFDFSRGTSEIASYSYLKKATENLKVIPETIDRKHWYLQNQTKNLIDKTKSRIVHVHSHQDKSFNELTHGEKLNEYCDNLATAFHTTAPKELQSTTSRNPFIPSPTLHLQTSTNIHFENFYEVIKSNKFKKRIYKNSTLKELI